MLRSRLACILPPSSLGPRVASGAFAVVGDEVRDQFIGDTRPLDSREKSIGHSHLPYYPRLCPVILAGTEMVQITSRAINDCSYLFEIPPSRSQSWLDHLSDENLVAVNTVVVVESCASADPFKAWRTKTTGNAYIDHLVVLSALQLSDVHVDSSHIEIRQRANALYDFSDAPTIAGKSGSTLSENLREDAWLESQGHLDPF